MLDTENCLACDMASDARPESSNMGGNVCMSFHCIGRAEAPLPLLRRLLGLKIVVLRYARRAQRCALPGFQTPR